LSSGQASPSGRRGISPAGGVVDDSKLRRRFYAALDRAQLKRLKFHSLRHTFRTVAVQAFPLSDVRAFMGHADIQTTMVYVHHVPQRDAADRLGALNPNWDARAVLSATDSALGRRVALTTSDPQNS